MRYALYSIALTVTTACGLVGIVACEQQNLGDAPAGSDGWLAGDAQQKFETIADQFGGFSQTMVEVGYRYTELYWAGKDENWEFAAYQIEHIEEAMEAGIQRRPARGRSAGMFMDSALAALSEAVEHQDQDMFRQRFEQLATNCNACHAMEEVSFIQVRIPTERYRPWGAP